MKEKKFFKTMIQIEVLSEFAPVSDLCPMDRLCWEMTKGAWSGVKDIISVEQLTPSEMVDALIAQGSDPEFFNLLTNT
jgi:hypothetical protein